MTVAIREFAARVARRARREAFARYLRPVPRADLARLGSDYGGWWVPSAALVDGANAYCAGAGEDISFDLALWERGCRVTTFDPTPRAIAYVERTAPLGDRFRFLPIGWWDVEDELKFYRPRDAAHVSHSVVNLQHTSDYFVATVKPVRQLMAELGDSHVDLVKMDIEGAEQRTIASLLDDGPLPPVLCVEFDQPQPLRAIVATVRRLQAAGYTLNKIEVWNYTFTR
jgi:FkbM family methyltransferase